MLSNGLLLHASGCYGTHLIRFCMLLWHLVRLCVWGRFKARSPKFQAIYIYVTHIHVCGNYLTYVVDICIDVWHVLHCECRLCYWWFCWTFSCRYLVGHMDCVWHLHTWRRQIPIKHCIKSKWGLILSPAISCCHIFKQRTQDWFWCFQAFLKRLGWWEWGGGLSEDVGTIRNGSIH